MRIIYFELDSYLAKKINDNVCAFGFFDGIHNGHKELLKKAVEVSKVEKIESSMITFSPSPQALLTGNKESLLTTVNERIEIAEEIGMDNVIILRFNKKLASLSPDDFYNKVIKILNIKHVVCGEDFRYGSKGSGSIKTLKDHKDLGLSVISDYKINENRVSSTLVKKSLDEGDMEKASEYLGYPYSIRGYVKHGRKKGRTLGFPTMNLEFSEDKYLPADGVYIGITTVDDKSYVSTINVGHNPTINTMIHKSIESYVHDFNQDSYSKSVTFKFVKKLRDELKFSGVEELIDQMNKDIKDSEEYFTEDVRKRYDIEII